MRLIRDHGGTVLTDANVSGILVEHGRAAAETDDGRRFVAQRAVVSSAHITSMGTMIGAPLGADLTAAADAWRPG